ncbi:uncharacterized protein [Physcomitrium patens]|uniref:uncharacterized protein isoform X2 n=1 Tax=Physcomitrium patens TaxID=3218 RepID=UPI000D168252|nr:two-component response regulator ARR3-like isoform X2 [Physcomitrium patens]|eukprot:XP_024361618.1 two-component response regulator ARR3-like isoform X2 [Physcomitrella patens]
MVRKTLEAEVRGECGISHPPKDLKPPKPAEADVLGIPGLLHQTSGGSKPKKAFKLVGQTKLPDMGLDVLKKTRKRGNSDGATTIPSPAQFFEDTLQKKVVGETRAETISLLSASLDNFCPDLVQKNLLLSELGAIKPAPVNTFQYHVLAVDDSSIDQRVIERLLKTSSYRVTTVNSAVRALDVLGLSESRSASSTRLDINLIMTDYCMPEMTGYDLLKRVKAQTSALKEIPVVLMSSENDSNRIERCLAEGAEEFIIKPVKMADVKRLHGLLKRPSTRSSSETGHRKGFKDPMA